MKARVSMGVRGYGRSDQRRSSTEQIGWAKGLLPILNHSLAGHVSLVQITLKKLRLAIRGEYLPAILIWF